MEDQTSGFSNLIFPNGNIFTNLNTSSAITCHKSKTQPQRKLLPEDLT